MKHSMCPGAAVIFAAMLVAAGSASAQSTKPSVESMPPSVVQTVPQAGDTAVDPALKEIRVTFSKNMMTDRMWSFVQISPQTFPETDGQIHYLADNRTCVLPVRLEPGKTYALWINQGRFTSFRDTHNTPSAPYLLVFETRK